MTENTSTITIDGKPCQATVRYVKRPIPMIISLQQQHASRQIVDNFKIGQRWCMLNAQMQSGKSTTYYLVASEMLRRKLVNKVVIFSGNCETELKNQVMDENKNKFLQAYENKILCNNPRKQDIIRMIRDNLHVFWGFHNITEYNDNPNNTLYIWDESHYAQTKDMGPHQFLTNIGISADGNQSLMKSKNVYMLSVSATPFSEYTNLLLHEQNKTVVRLEVTDEYHGVKNMLQRCLISGFNTDRWTDALQLVMKYHATTEFKYGLVRYRENLRKGITCDAVKSIVNGLGWNCLTFDSSSETDIHSINELAVKPTNNTIILLKGKCRMGKVVPNRHIAFCMETSKNPNSDVILQGLMGRMCGYNKNKNVAIYVSNLVISSGDLDRYVDYVEAQTATSENIIVPRVLDDKVFHVCN